MQAKQLTEIGLTKGEAGVYVSLLELGSTTVGPLVKKSGIAYSNVYEVLNRLTKKGMASFVLKNGTKYFQPASPEHLMDYIEGREKEIEKQKLLLKEFLPRLKSFHVQPEQEAEIFLGVKGLKAAYAKIADAQGDWCFFYTHKAEYAELTDRFYLSSFKMLKAHYARGVADKLYKKSRFVRRSKSFVKVKYVDFPVPANIDIRGEYALLISWSEQPVAFLIKSPSVAGMLHGYFESVWKSAKV